MGIRARIISKRTAVALILVGLASLVISTTSFATEAMKPGQGHGDSNHTHYGAPGRQ